MHFTANRLELCGLARQASRIAVDKSPVEALRGILLEADEDTGQLTLTVTNFEVSLQCRMKAAVYEGGNMVMSAKLLVEMLPLLGGNEVLFQQEAGGALAIQSGTCNYLVSVLPGKSYPKTEIPFPEDTVQVSGIPSMVHRTAFAVSTEESKPVMRCVNLMFSHDGLKAVGSDGSRVMSVKGIAKSTGSVSLLVPAGSLAKLAGLADEKDSFSVGTTGKAVVFTKENFVFSARLMDGGYINTDALLESVKGTFSILTDAETLHKALSSVDSIAAAGGKVCLSFKGNRLELSCTTENGSATTVQEVIPLTGTPTGAYYYVPQKLAECLRALSGTLTLQVAQGGVLLMSTEQATCLQTASRAPSAATIPKKKAKAA